MLMCFAQVMQKFKRHRNVVALLGIVTVSEPMMLLVRAHFILYTVCTHACVDVGRIYA